MASSVLTRRNAIRIGGATGLLALGGGQPARADESETLEANKALVRRLFAEIVNGGDEQLLAELYAPEYVNRDVSTWQEPTPGGLPLSLGDFRAALPTVQVTVEAAIAEGEYVATRESWSDWHPPAGTHLVGRTMHLFRIAGGQIVEQWSAGWGWLEPVVKGLEQAERNPLMSD